MILAVFGALLTACEDEKTFDACGTFEATEVIVSAETAGRLLQTSACEGDKVEKGRPIACVDSVQLCLQRRQLLAQQAAQRSGRPDIGKQAAALRARIEQQQREQQRLENLLRDGAVPSKQLDDVRANIRVLQGELSALEATLGNNSAIINDNIESLQTQVEMLTDRISKCNIAAPVSGTILTKYAEAGEYVTPGKPIFKIADLTKINLRAYFTSDQLAEIHLGDTVTVTADFGGDKRYEYSGIVAWISSECEFTPKNIQTKDTRANLVYAVKIAVRNDGRLKIGLAGEVRL